MEQQKDEISSLKSERTLRYQREHERRLQRLVPLLIIAAIGVFIAKQEVPAVDSWISRLINARAWEATEACNAAALAAAINPAFARLEKRGRAEQTGDGFYVGKVVVAELDAEGVQQRYRFSCNVSSGGEVVAIGKDGAGAREAGQSIPPPGEDEAFRP